jgi:hypothetical protein
LEKSFSFLRVANAIEPKNFFPQDVALTYRSPEVQFLCLLPKKPKGCELMLAALFYWCQNGVMVLGGIGLSFGLIQGIGSCDSDYIKWPEIKIDNRLERS